MGEDHENILACFFVVLRIDDSFWDLGLVHVQIASQCSPENAFEGCKSFAGNDTTDETDIHGCERLLITDIAVRTTFFSFRVAQERGIIIIQGLSDVFGLSMSTIEKSSGLFQYPAPLRQLSLTPFQGLVAVVQGADSLFKRFASVS